MNISIRISETLPVSPHLFRVLEDWKTADNDEWMWEGKPIPIRPAAYRMPNGGGVPATRKNDSVFVPMPREFQEWFYEVWKIFSPAGFSDSDLKRTWVAVWGDKLFQTNYGHGSETLADYINGTNLDQPPMARETIVMRGNTLRYHHEDSQWLYFDAITTDVWKTMTPAEFAQDRCLCHLATVINNTPFPDGSYGMDRFPQLSIKEQGIYHDVPTPLLAPLNEPYYKLKRWQVEEVPLTSPYNPQKQYSPLHPRK